MARPREFDEARAVEAAMRQFWEKGYEATSTQDLCAVTGLGRSSLYNAFSSKHALFLRALTHYTQSMTRAQVALLEDATQSATARLRALLESILDIEEVNRSDRWGIGCLGVNSTVELVAHDPDVAALLGRDQERRLAAFSDTIAAGQKSGEFSDARRPEELAAYLNAAIAGIRVAAQGGADRRTLAAVADTALEAFTR
ncbi:TetR/AcrR family transcriptional regulator [Streptomyces microflavus]|uniref:TetR/AcrR family transcriptional regulator n=1 Tax=Streptomyces microflavus TaxID=1919 RepID=A0A6N9V8F4_STRMI|nr:MULTISPECIES: TetR/AcrR family transcriptional regulator [Streptomyces]NEB68966.1 TetR/AcrR family transcriptional regulator [Streptomyces microflavus]OXY95977.1 transcriptional regulator [Streptomyces sp. 2R]QKW45993.1 TetR/AcrR family transcriptional regulator [Streptomyces microflavus]